jgi:RimJ/RimL family protein N-acetyltransferase
MLNLAYALGHARVKANHFTDNPASGRVLEKTGFRRTGETRMRASRARGGEAPVHAYEIELMKSDGDDGVMLAA